MTHSKLTVLRKTASGGVKLRTAAPTVGAPGGSGVLPWARRTRVGRRNLLTTASSGSANGLQVISDRFADNFSILPGHHASGDNGEDSGGDNTGGVSEDAGGEAGEDGGDGGAIMSEFRHV